jgi:hypothetical protein
MRSCVAAPVAVIPSLLLSALSAALQRRARKLAVYSLLSAALPFLQGGASGLNPCDSICALSPKLQEKGRGQKEQAKARGLLRYVDGATRTRTAACAATILSGSEQCTEMHRCLGGCLDGCLDGCLGWWVPWLVGSLAGGCLGWWMPWLVGALPWLVGALAGGCLGGASGCLGGAGGCLGWWVPWWGCWWGC